MEGKKAVHACVQEIIHPYGGRLMSGQEGAEIIHCALTWLQAHKGLPPSALAFDLLECSLLL